MGRKRARRIVLSAVMMGLLCLAGVGDAPAKPACVVQREQPGQSQLFVRHLSGECSKADREAHAVHAVEVLEALKAGKGISLQNAFLTGSVLLTELPSVPVASLELTPTVLSRMSRARVSDVRVIRGPFMIQNSVVEGIIDTQLKPDLLEHRLLGDMVVIQGPVSFVGTTFVKDVDWSRTVFTDTVDSSGAIYLGDAFFLYCVFTKPTTFAKTAFSANTRFYQTVFAAPVTFLRAGFNGLTNFLSVSFQKEASFSRAYFKMGTGFSGSRFEGISDFSEAVFEKAAFFTSTVFAADAYFRRVTFRGDVNFSDAAFKGHADFAKVFYTEEPNFTRTVFASPRWTAGFENPVFLAVVTASLIVFFIVFVILLKRG
jgi:uncharacterized protein YjbI with pentapeptide repeats